MERLTAALSSRYVIEREIGRGGMATVFLARDLRHDSIVAVKVLHPDLAPLLASERFAREIRFTAGLQHPSILPVLDSGDADGLPFYVMPYVEGESLASRIERERQLPISEALGYARDIARALSHAHARGVVHRDIKPANILLSHGQAIVADFGIARAIDSAGGERLTESGLAIGTALYMSPEQAAGEVVDGRSDIYSLGCLLYEMLAGNPPFAGGSPQSVLARHAIDVPPPIRTVRATVSPEIQAAIERALAKAPSDRFADAGQLADALDIAERDAHSSATRPKVARKTNARRTAVTVAVGAIAAIVIAVGGYAFLRSRSTDALDPHRIVVFPLAVSGDLSKSPALGEDVATVIGHSLDGTGQLHWIDGWRLLGARADAARGTGVEPQAARALAKARESGFYLTGRIVPRGDSVEVFVDLIDVRGDTVVRRGSATSARDAAWRAGLTSVNAVLPALVPGASSRDLAAEWSDRAPAAVAEFLLGEAAFRRARADEALSHYRDAVRTDSTFALAAIRGAQAATWEHRESEAESLIQRALKLPMSPSFTHFAVGYQAYLEGRPDSAANELRRALAIDPEMAAAWLQLGETYTHLLPVAGRADTLAEAAFSEALRLDSAAGQMLFHPIEISLRRGDERTAGALLARFLAANPDTILAAHLRVMHVCVTKSARSVDWQREVSAHPLAVLGAAQSLAVAGAQLPCAEAAYVAMRTYETPEMAATNSAADSRRWASLVGLTGVLVAESRVAEATLHVDSAIARHEGGASLYLVGAAASPALRDAGVKGVSANTHAVGQRMRPLHAGPRVADDRRCRADRRLIEVARIRGQPCATRPCGCAQRRTVPVVGERIADAQQTRFSERIDAAFGHTPTASAERQRPARMDRGVGSCAGTTRLCTTAWLAPGLSRGIRDR